ncbi:uroporphyrinogen-III synthase, partial [Verminephrobacter eiseniae]
MTVARVIVTRPAREAAHWVAQLGAHGISAAALPLIAIAPCTDPAAQQALRAARAQLAHQRPPYRALMFVSSNAVAHFFASDEGPLAPAAQALGATKTRAWAPGPGTACALLQAGIARQCIDRPAPEAAQFDSRALWQQVAAQVRPGDRVLIVHGRSRGAPASAQDHQGRQGHQGRDWLARQIGA